MDKLILSFSIIGFGISLGYFIQIMVNRGKLSLKMGLDALRIRLQKIGLLFFMPVTILLATWIVRIETPSLAAFPLVGLSAILLGGILALSTARLLRLENKKAGAFFACGSFTNIGSIGALVCFIFLGEKGFALVPIYKLLEETTYYSVGFPICKYLGSAEQSKEGTFDRLKGLIKDPFIRATVSSLLLGGILNVSNIPRPEFFGMVNTVFIPVGTSLLLISIGLAMRFRSVVNYLKECFSLSLIKFLLVPVAITAFAWNLGYGEIDKGIPLKVVLILSSMPVAFNALIPPSIYDLDIDLANSCWLFTTSCLVITLPILMFLLQMI